MNKATFLYSQIQLPLESGVFQRSPYKPHGRLYPPKRTMKIVSSLEYPLRLGLEPMLRNLPRTKDEILFFRTDEIKLGKETRASVSTLVKKTN